MIQNIIKHKKTLSILMIFLVLIQLTGCYGFKEIETNEIAFWEVKNHIIHYRDNQYNVKYVAQDDVYMQWEIQHSNLKSDDFVNIFIVPSAEVTIVDNTISFKIEDIAKTEKHQIKLAKTIYKTVGLSVGIGFGAFVTLFIIMMSSSGGE